jgi:DNA-binding transcriptional MocR family regulator
MRGAARAGGNGALAGYASPRGSLPLRVLLARRMADQGIEAGPEQILLTDSGTHALDLVCRFLLQPGDAHAANPPSSTSAATPSLRSMAAAATAEPLPSASTVTTAEPAA